MGRQELIPKKDAVLEAFRPLFKRYLILLYLGRGVKLNQLRPQCPWLYGPTLSAVCEPFSIYPRAPRDLHKIPGTTSTSSLRSLVE